MPRALTDDDVKEMAEGVLSVWLTGYTEPSVMPPDSERLPQFKVTEHDDGTFHFDPPYTGTVGVDYHPDDNQGHQFKITVTVERIPPEPT